MGSFGGTLGSGSYGGYGGMDMGGQMDTAGGKNSDKKV